MEALAGFFHEYAPMLWQGLGETCLMTFGALLCSYALGLPLGVLLTLVESALAQVPPNLVESARAWGATPLQTAWRVLLPEAAPALVRGLAITGVTLTAYSAMAGAVGAGGLGDIAIRYGYHRYEYGVMMATLVLLILFVQLLQGVCALVARRMEERVR